MMEWISVEDRLPEIHDHVQVTVVVHGRGITPFAYVTAASRTEDPFHEGVVRWASSIDGDYLDYPGNNLRTGSSVIGWMPIEEPMPIPERFT